MPRSRTHHQVRSAFTLIELLVVIAIIAVLVGLLSSAVLKVIATKKRTEASDEIRKIEGSLQVAMKKYNDAQNLPSKLILLNKLDLYLAATLPAETPQDTALRNRSRDTLRRMFGQRFLQQSGAYISWDGAASPTDSRTVLQGHQCLVFYLGGVGGFAGFSPDPLNPMAPGGERIGPYFAFKKNRLAGTGPFYSYLDPYRDPIDPLAKPYAYFSSTTAPNTYNPYYSFPTNRISDCQALGVWPYIESAGNYINPKTYQIITAGPDGQFGAGGGEPGSPATFSGSVYDPLIGAKDVITRDNQANFSTTMLQYPK